MSAEALKRYLAAIITVVVLVVGISPPPLTTALSQIEVQTDKSMYTAGDSVYIFGKVASPVVSLAQVNITVTKPSGDIWARVMVRPDSTGNFGATVGVIQPLDSTGMYMVTARYLLLTNTTIFEVRTPSTITVGVDKPVYLADETVTVSGRVSPLIKGYLVTLRIGTSSSWRAVGQVAPMANGTYVFKDFYKVTPQDSGIWVVNASYGPFSFATTSFAIGLKMSLSSGVGEYLPGQIVNITGSVSPIISGPVKVVIRNPRGGVWVKAYATPSEDGVFTVTQTIYPGSQVGEYRVEASYWGISTDSVFTVGQLGNSTMKIVSLGVYDIFDNTPNLIPPGSMVRVKATLLNRDVVSHPFTFIIQIKDSGGRVVFIGTQSSTVKAGSFEGQTVGTTLDSEGRYTIEVFVWDGLSTANPLSEVHTLNLRVG